jgi:SAM-dependent methyltransferase
MNAAHLEFCGSSAWREIVQDLILPPALEGVDLGDDVLEIGPGPGFTTDVLRERAERLTAVEIDPALADALARRLAGTNVVVIEGDAASLDLPDGRFTGAASFHMIHHVPTDEAQDSIFRELHRVLRPDGVVVVADAGFRPDTVEFHADDTYHPIEMEDISARLEAAGFTAGETRSHDLGWVCTARA